MGRETKRRTMAAMRGETPAGLPIARPPGSSRPAPIYVVGLFGMGYGDFYNVLIPLDGLSLGDRAGAGLSAAAVVIVWRKPTTALGRQASFVILDAFLALMCLPVAHVTRRGARLAAAEPAG